VAENENADEDEDEDEDDTRVILTKGRAHTRDNHEGVAHRSEAPPWGAPKSRFEHFGGGA
jgi:hypothetical protein